MGVNSSALPGGVRYLLNVCAIQECGDLCTGASVIRCKPVAANTVRHAVRDGPRNSIGVVAVGRNIGERRGRTALAVQRTRKERNCLCAGADGIRVKRGGRGAVGDTVLDRPRNGLGIVRAGRYIGEAGHALGLGRTGRTPQERDDMSSGAAVIGREQVIRHAAGDTLVCGPLYRIKIVRIDRNIVKRAGFGRFDERRTDAYLAARHGERVFAVALVRHSNGVALCILNRYTTDLVALSRSDDDRHGAALGGVFRANGHRTACGLTGRGDFVARRAAAGGAGALAGQTGDGIPDGRCHCINGCLLGDVLGAVTALIAASTAEKSV